MNNSTGTIAWIVIIAVFATFVVIQLRMRANRAAQNTAEGVTHSLDLPFPGSLRLTAAELVEGYTEDSVRHPVAGLKASVDDSGTVNRRMTMTRMLALGPLAVAAPKKLDDRCLYLTIEGPDTIVVREIKLKDNPQLAAKAREFAAKINQLGGVGTLPKPSLPAAQPSTSAGARLDELGKLRDAGHLNEDEYQSKRSEIIRDL